MTHGDRWEEIERVGLRRWPSSDFDDMFARCATAGCLFELHARRYADNTPELTKLAFKDLSEVVDAICEHVKARTSDDERAVLQKCPKLRNKLFHLELSRVTGHLRAFGVELDEGKVFGASLADGSVSRVSDTSTKSGRIQGWLMESSISGAFESGFGVFRRGIALLGWLLSVDSGATTPG